VENLESRLVPTLTAVSATAGYPWTSIASLQITFPDGTTAVGSGALVDSFHVLTAGHALYSSANGGFASSIQVIPELNGTSQPFGSAFMAHERVYDTWINADKQHPGKTGDGNLDIGLITLDRTLGNQTGWMAFGYNNNDNAFAGGTIFNTAGYPASNGYDGTTMEWSAGALTGLSGDGSRLKYNENDITAYGGQSGSPVWAYTPSNGNRVIYGVHVGGTGLPGSLSSATRITDKIFTDFTKVMATDVQPNLVHLGGLHVLDAVTPIVKHALPLGAFNILARANLADGLGVQGVAGLAPADAGGTDTLVDDSATPPPESLTDFTGWTAAPPVVNTVLNDTITQIGDAGASGAALNAPLTDFAHPAALQASFLRTLASGAAGLATENIPPADASSVPPTGSGNPGSPVNAPAPSGIPPISLPTLPASTVLTAGLGIPVSPVVPPDVVPQAPLSTQAGTALKITTVHHPLAHHTVGHHNVHQGLHAKTLFVTGLH
jgi:V8-like Glu-specific endopeptidase